VAATTSAAVAVVVNVAFVVDGVGTGVQYIVSGVVRDVDVVVVKDDAAVADVRVSDGDVDRLHTTVRMSVVVVTLGIILVVVVVVGDDGAGILVADGDAQRRWCNFGG
jgi:hypothetical protein